MYLLKIKFFTTRLFLKISEPYHRNPYPRTRSQDLQVPHYDFEENEQKTLHKYAINQVTQGKIRTTSNRNVEHNSYSLLKSPSYHINRI